jgi:dihydrofolate reductase
MSLLRVFESISVDGYFADTAGRMDWAHAVPQSPAFSVWVNGNASSGGALLFGRVTYEMMASFWPTPMAAQQMPTVAQGMNAATKYVATRTIAPTWANTTRLSDDAVTAVAALKAAAGPDITILGSGSLVAQLGAAGLVDQYQFVVIPTALGAGRTLFAAPQPLRLEQQQAFPCGRVVVTYSPIGRT